MEPIAAVTEVEDVEEVDNVLEDAIERFKAKLAKLVAFSSSINASTYSRNAVPVLEQATIEIDKIISTLEHFANNPTAAEQH